MKKIIRLTESDLARIVEKVLKQKNIQEVDPMDGTSDFPLLAANDEKKPEDDIESMTQQVAEYWARKRRKNRISEQLISATDRDSKSRQICYKYKVQNGDNMWDIASKMREKFAPNQPMNDYWYDWKANMVEFNIVDLNKIKTGDIIPIPQSCGKMNK